MKKSALSAGACGIALFALASCGETPQEKLERLQAVQQDTAKMKQDILKMEADIISVTTIPDEQQTLRTVQKDIFFLQEENTRLDDYIDAMQLRKDAMKVKFDNFVEKNPISK